MFFSMLAVRRCGSRNGVLAMPGGPGNMAPMPPALPFDMIELHITFGHMGGGIYFVTVAVSLGLMPTLWATADLPTASYRKNRMTVGPHATSMLDGPSSAFWRAPATALVAVGLCVVAALVLIDRRATECLTG